MSRLNSNLLRSAFAIFVISIFASPTSYSQGKESTPSGYKHNSHWWDQRRDQYPDCHDLINKHEELTKQVYNLHEKVIEARGEKRKQLWNEYQELVDRRQEVREQMYDCFGPREKKPPLLKAGVSRDVKEEKPEGDPGPNKDIPPLKPRKPQFDIVPIPGRVQKGGGGGSPTLSGGTNRNQPANQNSSATHGNQPQQSQPRQRASNDDSRTDPKIVFNFYYINGINTPYTGHGRGNATWDRKLIAGNLLDLTERVGDAPQRGGSYEVRINMGDEENRLAPMTHNPSGLDPLSRYHPVAHEWILKFCDGTHNTIGKVDKDLADQFCLAAKWIDRNRRFTGEDATGDLLECLRQAIEVFPGQTGIKFSAGTDVVKQVTGMMLETYKRESETNERHYFIVIAHSQGNFFGEGVGYRLSHYPGVDQSIGLDIFENRLGILSLGSPTSYDSLPQWFRERRISHVTRADDAINILRNIPLPSKKPWPARYDYKPLWDWKPGMLKNAMQIGVPGVLSPYLHAMSLKPPDECLCPEPFDALYVPLLGSHLLENYLADPPLAEPGRAMHPQAANLIGLSEPVTPRANPVLGNIRFGIFQLKQDLLEK